MFAGYNDSVRFAFWNMIKRLLLLLFCLLTYTFESRANSDSLLLHPAVKRLAILGDSVLKGSTDAVRIKFLEPFSTLLDSILRSPGGTELSFYQVRALSVANASGKQVKTLTWLVSLENGSNYNYYGYILYKTANSGETKIVRLHHQPDLPREELEILKGDSSNWIGCIYYDVHVERYKKKDYFLMLGWAPQNGFITRKIIEPLVISSTKVTLGVPVIKAGGKAKARLVFDYNAQVSMSLKYNEKEKMIVMDHLSSSDPRPEAKGMYALYGPDFSYDGLKFSKGQWVLIKDLDVRN